MNIETMREFLVCVCEPSLAKAADVLHLSPSALSKHLTSLEDELGVSLFVDRRKGVLSESGELFLATADHITREYDGMTSRIDELIRGSRSVVRLAFVPLAQSLLEVVSRAQGRLQAQDAGTTLRVLTPDKKSMLDVLGDDEADAAIVPASSEEALSRYRRRKLFESPMYISVRRETGIAEGSSIMQLRGLALYRPRNAIFREYCDCVVSVFSQQGVELDVRLSGSNTIEESQSHDSPERIFCFPEEQPSGGNRQANFFTSQRRVFRLSEEGARIPWYLVWRPDRETDALLHLADLMVQESLL